MTPKMKAAETTRYHLTLPQAIYEAIKALAESHGLNMIDVFRKFIALGISAAEAEADPSKGKLFFRDKDGSEQKVLLFERETDDARFY